MAAWPQVYDPCTLLTKKRYAGYMYESPNQASPAWDAKVSPWLLPGVPSHLPCCMMGPCHI
jgi:hypothetical protein